MNTEKKKILVSNIQKNSIPMVAMILVIAIFYLLMAYFIKKFDGDYEWFSGAKLIVFFLSIVPIVFSGLFDGNVFMGFAISLLAALGFIVQSMLNNGKKETFIMIVATLIGYGSAYLYIRYYDKVEAFIRNIPVKVSEKHKSRVSQITDKAMQFIGHHFRLAFIIILNVVSVVIFALLIFGGQETNGANISFMGLQIGEFNKITYGGIITIILSEDSISDRKRTLFTLIQMAAFAVGYVLMNELGSLLIILVTTVVLMFMFIDSKRSLLLGLGSLAAIIAVGIVLYLISKESAIIPLPERIITIADKVISRWEQHINPTLENAYQIVRGQTVISAGGLLGCDSTIFVPEFSSDMIFTYIAYRFGFIFSFGVTAVYFFMFFCGQATALREKNKSKKILLYYLSTIVLISAVIPILGSTNYIMLTGLPLPLLSEGGVSYIVVKIFVTILLAASCKIRIGMADKATNIIRQHPVLQSEEPTEPEEEAAPIFEEYFEENSYEYNYDEA